ncbi:hypothetical protein GOODEAATRI_029531 [Goodea atripinnis]|uniref:Uncharacterized protein n=1 Tax=Goodea atripinnis TaxID=208336 RepID=A0ABV0NQ92_9TELE
MEEMEERIFATEDSLSAHGTSVAGMKKTVEQLQLKVNDLENHGRRKNLKMTNHPEKTEGNIPLADFLQTTLLILVSLPAYYTKLDIESVHCALASTPTIYKPLEKHL